MFYDYYTNKKVDSSKSQIEETSNTQSARTDEQSTNLTAKAQINLTGRRGRESACAYGMKMPQW